MLMMALLLPSGGRGSRGRRPRHTRTAPMEPPRDAAAENAARDGETDPEALLRDYYVTESCAERQGTLIYHHDSMYPMTYPRCYHKGAGRNAKWAMGTWSARRYLDSR
eukprot:COSAG02_NODE_26983_length_619_cov_1.755769_1_plen_107_part_10